MATNFKTLKEYLYPDNGKKKFIIPNYQRGYKWSVRNGKEETSVEYLLSSLLDAFHNNPTQQYFLQGVTVVEEGDNIILIDGQQRTTTLYLLLWCLGRENISGHKDINLDYSIRTQSRDFIAKLKETDFDFNSYDENNRIQDIYYFKEAIKQINDKLPAIEERVDFLNYLLNKISLLYIVISRSKAIRTFTMMNGQKAAMHDEELVKAEILHIISLPDTLNGVPAIKSIDDTYAILQEIVAVDWETNALRSKYAREWDKWLYWWYRDDVSSFFNTNKPMGLLLEYYFIKSNHNEKFSFKTFKQLLPDGDKRKAKEVFKGLRDLQKDFEDIFNDPRSFNNLKLAMISSNGDVEDKYNIIMFFIANKRNYKTLEEYSRWRLIGSTHKEMTEEFTVDIKNENQRVSNEQRRSERARNLLEKFCKSHVYNVIDSEAYKQLLRLNVIEYNRLNDNKGVKFDFSIWDNKSLEHIYPKPMFYHSVVNEETQEIRFVRGDGTEITLEKAKNLRNSDTEFSNPSKYSEHCIGNLVLLYGKNNSEFSNLPFEEKKFKFFHNERTFESRNLLHTISSFASSKWDIEEIETNADLFIERFKKDYNIQDNNE